MANHTSITGIPTTYLDTVFRSRLEARWAAFADLAGWQWTYEPFDGSGYLPDFCFTVAGRPLLIEVKPVATIEDARTHLPKIVAGIGGLWRHDVIIAGIEPARTLYVDFLANSDNWHSGCAEWTICPYCNLLDIHPAPWTMDCKTCKWHEMPRRVPADAYIQMLWRAAGNTVRWEASA